MESLIEYITQYGLAVFVIATCIIAIIGILKLCKVFDKIQSKNVKKLVYYILNIAFAFGGSAIYFAIYGLDFAQYLMFSASQVTATTTLYAIYENFGVRKLVQMFFDWIVKICKKNPDSKLTKTLKKLGLNEATVQKIQAEADAALADIEKQKAAEKSAGAISAQ